MWKILVLVLAALTLASCAGIPTEYTSPCACNYEPINNKEKAIT